MPKRIDACWLQHDRTQAVFRALADAGYSARVVGGAVRNALLGAPVDDIDIATTAEPHEVTQLAEAAGLRVVATGLAHGTVTVISGGHPYEVTTLRQDVATFGRHATVAFTQDWQADASRRDFTMNALYCEAGGQLFDPLGGLADLEARRVRFIGDPHARIREDYLRILRFFRFFAQYGTGTPDAAGLLASVQERHGLRQLSGERVRQELLKLVCAPRAGEALTAMCEHGLLTELVPAAPNPAAFNRLRATDKPPTPALRLAALTVHVAEDCDRLADRLRLSNNERGVLRDYAAAIAAPLGLPDSDTRKVLLYRLGPDRYRIAILARAARGIGFGEKGAQNAIGATDARDAIEAALDLPSRWTAPAFPLSGADVIAAGVKPGRRVGEILERIETRWIADGFAADRDALLQQLPQELRR